jgi:hypothetical protein
MTILTIEGPRDPSPKEIAYMEYLDEIAELPSGHSFGLLLFKGDPIAFRLGLEEWQAQEPSPQDRAAEHGCYIGHDLHGWYIADESEAEADERGPSVGFDGRAHFATEEDAVSALERDGVAALKSD